MGADLIVTCFPSFLNMTALPFSASIQSLTEVAFSLNYIAKYFVTAWDWLRIIICDTILEFIGVFLNLP